MLPASYITFPRLMDEGKWKIHWPMAKLGMFLGVMDGSGDSIIVSIMAPGEYVMYLSNGRVGVQGS